MLCQSRREAKKHDTCIVAPLFFCRPSVVGGTRRWMIVFFCCRFFVSFRRSRYDSYTSNSMALFVLYLTSDNSSTLTRTVRRSPTLRPQKDKLAFPRYQKIVSTSSRALRVVCSFVRWPRVPDSCSFSAVNVGSCVCDPDAIRQCCFVKQKPQKNKT